MRPLHVPRALATTAILILVPLLHADWPMAGRDASRNAVSPEKDPPLNWQIRGTDDNGRLLKISDNVRWQARLGTNSRGGLVVAGGLVWVGTNNQHPRDPKQPGDASVLMCFRERDGKFLWQYVSPRIGKGGDFDGQYASMAAPLAEGDRLWMLTNRSEVVCLDVGALQRGTGEPKVLWKTDLIKDMGVKPRGCMCQPHLTSGALGPVYKNWLYVVTGNGRDDERDEVLAPGAPSLVCFDKDTGKVVWQDNSPGKNVLALQTAAAALVTHGSRTQVVAAQGDGWLRAFDPATGKVVWKCDLNFEVPKAGRSKPYPVAAPVVAGHRVYVGLGHDPDAADLFLPGCFWCIDATGEGDVSPVLSQGRSKGEPNPRSAVVWRYGGAAPVQPGKKGRRFVLENPIGPCVVHDGLVYLTEYPGYLHCLDAATGRSAWVHDLVDAAPSGPLWAGGKVYVATDSGTVWVFDHGSHKPRPTTIETEWRLLAAPVYVNGVLYLMTSDTLYAIRGGQ